MTSLTLYANSLRHLRPIQLSSRVRLLTRRKLLYRSGSLRASRYGCPVETPYRRLDLAPAAPVAEATHDYDADKFTFLNHTVALGDPIDWLPENATQLWKYNLHYFDYTVALAYAYQTNGERAAYTTFRRLAASWMDSCPLATPVAWDPYPISLRASNWLKAYTWFADEIDQDASFAARIRQSIWTQVRFLEDNLEYHLLGNHLIENGRALLLAGLFFEDDAAARWRQKGMQILASELTEQFLDDGGHYERSPMYHQIMLHLYSDVVDALARQAHTVADELTGRVEAMRGWLANMLHPDGEITLFNDAAFGIAGPPAHQLHGEQAPDGFRALPDSGYFVFRDAARGHSLHFDCGPLGPDYQPGHGHCDALSYELSVDGTRLIVDAGVSNYYGDEAWRQYYRSTRAHNTVAIDGAEQSEIWGRFRVGQRAYPHDVVFDDEGDLAYVIGSHTGFRRLSGRPEHRRWLGWVERRFWLVCDRIAGEGAHEVESFIHFHPDATVARRPDAGSGTSGLVTRAGAAVQVVPWGAADIRSAYGQKEPIQGWYAPEFGLNQANRVWALHRNGELPHWMGYLLWPGEETVHLTVDVADVDSLCLTITAPDAVYRITCTYDEIKMEKEA